MLFKLWLEHFKLAILLEELMKDVILISSRLGLLFMGFLLFSDLVYDFLLHFFKDDGHIRQ